MRGTSGSIPFDRVADRYDETRGGVERGQRMAEAIAPHLSDGDRTVEVGVGTGVVALGLGQRGRRVVGIDLSPAMLRHAQPRVDAGVVLGDGTALPFAHGTVDNVYGVWVLHLVGDPAAVVCECQHVLRRGGRVVFVSGGPRSGQDDDDLAPFEASLAPLRDRGDTADKVISWAEAAGLVVVGQSETTQGSRETPADVAQRLEDRVLAFLWDVDDVTWRRLVQPVIDGLRSLPDQHRRRPRVHHHDLLVFEKP